MACLGKSISYALSLLIKEPVINFLSGKKFCHFIQFNHLITQLKKLIIFYQNTEPRDLELLVLAYFLIAFQKENEGQ